MDQDDDEEAPPPTMKELHKKNLETLNKIYEYPPQLKRMFDADPDMPLYAEAKQKQKVPKYAYNDLKRAMGLKSTLNVDHYLERFIAETFGRCDGDPHVDGESPSASHGTSEFQDPDNEFENTQFKVLLDKLSPFLDPRNYYDTDYPTHHMIPPEIARFHLPLQYGNLKRAVKRFFDLKPIMEYIILNHNRPEFLRRVPLPPNIEKFPNIKIPLLPNQTPLRKYNSFPGGNVPVYNAQKRFLWNKKRKYKQGLRKSGGKVYTNHLKKKFKMQRSRQKKERILFQKLLKERAKKMKRLKKEEKKRKKRGGGGEGIKKYFYLV
uniref:Uncharacterized protein n=1 Tax=Cacopsylla melanoneura TaxID=428564 RepID=A0A8D9ANG0_9HEMI